MLIGICVLLSIGMATADSIPDLTGKWIVEKTNYVQYSGEMLNKTSDVDHWNITQQGTIIQGTNVFSIEEGIVEEPFAGVISPDGKTAQVVDKSGGTYILYMNDDDTLTVNYLNTGDKKEEDGYAFALSQIMRRTE